MLYLAFLQEGHNISCIPMLKFAVITLMCTSIVTTVLCLYSHSVELDEVTVALLLHSGMGCQELSQVCNDVRHHAF